MSQQSFVETLLSIADYFDLYCYVNTDLTNMEANQQGPIKLKRIAETDVILTIKELTSKNLGVVTQSLLAYTMVVEIPHSASHQYN